MASGDTLAVFTALDASLPASNYATLDTRNNHPVLDFDATTQESAFFDFILPRNYAGGGITAYLHWMATSAVSGTGGWDVSFERDVDAGDDLDADSFATAQTVTAATVPATSGVVKVTSVALANGAALDNMAAGDAGRVRIRRDVANDSATGDLELLALELKET